MGPSVALGVLGCLVATGPRLVYLDTPVGTYSVHPEDVSRDGSTIVGVLSLPGPEHQAFWWTLAEGLAPLGFHNGLHTGAWGCSGDGSVIVGYARPAPVPTGAVPMRWTLAGGFASAPAPGMNGALQAVSDDGLVGVGIAFGTDLSRPLPIRWQVGHEVELLAHPIEAGIGAVNDVSSDGSLAAGYVAPAGGAWTPRIWLADGGVIDTPSPLAGHDAGWGSISGDGRFCAGVLFNESDRWEVFTLVRSSGQTERLGTWDGRHMTQPVITDDGRLVFMNAIVDLADPATDIDAMVWTPTGGLLLLTDWLRDEHGLDVGETLHSRVAAVSGDGTVLTGFLWDAGVRYRPWVIDLDACLPDLNADGAVDFFDVQRFLNAYAAGEGVADLIVDHQLDFFDVQAFLNAYAAGCP